MASLTSTVLSKIPSSSPKILAITQRFPQPIAPQQIRPVSLKGVLSKAAIKATSQSAATGSQSPGLYSAQKFELTAQNVDLVLEDVRPYLIADGGNVDVVSVEDGVISLKLQGNLTLFHSFIFLFPRSSRNSLLVMIVWNYVVNCLRFGSVFVHLPFGVISCIINELQIITCYWLINLNWFRDELRRMKMRIIVFTLFSGKKKRGIF